MGISQSAELIERQMSTIDILFAEVETKALRVQVIIRT